MVTRWASSDAGASRSTPRRGRRRRRARSGRPRSRRGARGSRPQHVAVELGGDALGVVVGGFEPADVLHQVGAEQQAVAGPQVVGQLGSGTACARRARSCRWSSRGTRPCAGPRGQVAEVALEVADDGVDGDAGVLGGDLRGRGPHRRLVDLEGDEPREPAAAGEGVEQRAGLVRRARAELDQGVGAATPRRWRRPRRAGSPARSRSGSTRAAG